MIFPKTLNGSMLFHSECELDERMVKTRRIWFLTAPVEIQNIAKRRYHLIPNTRIQVIDISSEVGANECHMIRAAKKFVSQSVLGLNLL